MPSFITSVRLVPDTDTLRRQRSVLRVQSVLGTQRGRSLYGHLSGTDKRLLYNWGHVVLKHPVVVPVHIKRTVTYLNEHCFVCNAHLAPRTKRTCPTEGCPVAGLRNAQPRWSAHLKMYLRVHFMRRDCAIHITPLDVYNRLQTDPHAQHLMQAVVAVPPIYVRGGAHRRAKPMTSSVRAITARALALRANMEVRIDTRADETEPQNVLWRKLQRDVCRLVDGRMRPSNEGVFSKPPDSAVTRFCLPKAKSARLRGTVHSKIQQWVCRAVISVALDGDFHLHDVGIPAWIAERLRVREGDWVMVNRAPTLHVHSMLGHRVRLSAAHENVIRLHPGVLTGYNADFDGDEMHVFVPQTACARAEVSGRMSVDANLVDHAGKPQVAFIQNSILGAELLRLRSDSAWLPPGFTHITADTIIVNGVLVHGGVWKSESLNALIPLVCEFYEEGRGGARTAQWVTDAYSRFMAAAGTEGVSITLAAIRAWDEADTNSHLGLLVSTNAKGGAKELRMMRDSIGPQEDSHGVVMHTPTMGFLAGLKARDFFAHMTAGRAALVDTSVHTPETGLLQKLITMATESLVLDDDGIIRDYALAGHPPLLEAPGTGPLPQVGPMIGIIVPQTIVAQLTQSNLRTFHTVGTAGTVKLGIGELTNLLQLRGAVRARLEALPIAKARETLRAELSTMIERMLGNAPPDTFVNLVVARMTTNDRVKSLNECVAEYGAFKRAALLRPFETLLGAALRYETCPMEGPLDCRTVARPFRTVKRARTAYEPHYSPTSPACDAPYSPSYRVTSPDVLVAPTQAPPSPCYCPTSP